MDIEKRRSNRRKVCNGLGGMASSQKYSDGTPCTVKVVCTVWSGGKDGDYIKLLPITITKY